MIDGGSGQRGVLEVMAMGPDSEQTDEVRYGKPLLVFRPMRGNIMAGFIISLLLMVAGVASAGFPLRAASRRNWNLPNFDENHLCWVYVGLAVIFGIGLFLGGWALVFYSSSLLSRRLEIYEAGFCNFNRRYQSVKWMDIVRVCETIVYARPPVVHFPASLLVPKVVNASYSIFTKSGEQFDYDGNSVFKIKKLGSLLRSKAEIYGWTWNLVEHHH